MGKARDYAKEELNDEPEEEEPVDEKPTKGKYRKDKPWDNDSIEHWFDLARPLVQVDVFRGFEISSPC
eukprot:gene23585-28565_t